MLRCLAGIALLFATAVSAGAQDVADCSDAMTQLEMTQCAHQDWEKADMELNTVYKAAMDKMRATDSDLPDYLKGAEDKLRDAQRAWIPYRDNACDAYGFLARGGTMEPMLIYGCRADLTRRRIGELQELIVGFGN
ncbi:lysozyme inhibitor LprI family protein [Roseibium sp. M-1]